MEYVNATGYFGRPSEHGQKAMCTKVHYVKQDGTVACGYTPHPSMKFQWCANAIHWDYIECAGCKAWIRKQVDQLKKVEHIELVPRKPSELSSCVTKFKELYRTASKVQRSQMRGWMRTVLSDRDSTR